MSIIQSIRDRPKIFVIVIALALLSFILTDYFSSKTRAGNGNAKNSVGTVNGKNINSDDFSRKLAQQEDNMKRQGYPSSPATQQLALDNVWENEVTRILLENEYDKLGISVSNKELGDILYGPNAPQDLKSQFTDPKTGQYNAVQAKQQIDNILKNGSPEQKASFNEYINSLIEQRKSEKYIALMNNSTNVPRWYVEKTNADNSLMGKASFVKEVYSSISDSTIKIEDKEIQDYVNKHKDQFKQVESRTINYVAFNASPSSADSLAARNSLLKKKEQFDTTSNTQEFLLSESIDETFNYDGYKSAASVTSPVKDSIFKIPVGSVYGPYLDGPNYVLAKLEGVRQISDTAKVRHILIATMDRDQNGQMYEKRDTATARKLADSIRTAIAGGANFDTLAAKFSDDPGSKDKGGVYESVYAGQMVGPFNDFIFLNGVGSKGVVKTSFGYHYMEVLSQKGSSTGYKISYLPMEIVVSDETDKNANMAANNFAGDSRDQKSFDANYEKTYKPQGYKKAGADVLKKDAQIPGLGYARQFIKDVYDAKKGEVMKPVKINDNYVVAVVTDVVSEGTQTVAKARPSVEAILRNKKKADMIKQKIGKITTLEAAAAALNKPIEVADSLRLSDKSSTKALGYEPKVIGAVFNPANKGKVVPEALAGVNGVYVVRVDNITTTSVTVGPVADQRKAMAEQWKQSYNPIEALKKGATIKDRRSDRY